MTTTAELPGTPWPRIDVFYLGGRHGELDADSGSDAASGSDEFVAAELQGVQRRRARDTAREAELILDLAAERPAGADPRPGTPGARRPGPGRGGGRGGGGGVLPPPPFA